MTTIQRDIELLHAKFAPIAETWRHICVDDLGIDLRITETLRSEERQKQLQKKGASQLKLGWHNYGLAFDFAVFDCRGVYDTNNRTGDYTRCGLIAEALELVWGGRWKFRDYGHVQHSKGMTLQQYLNGRKKGIAI